MPFVFPDEPPREFSPAPFWWWSGARLDPARLRWQMEQLIEGGVCNVVITHLAPTCPNYGADADDPSWFSERWWEIFLGVCADAKELGMRLWFCDQLGFACCNIHEKLIAQNPEYAGYALEVDEGKAAIVRRGYDFLQSAAAGALIDAVHGEFARRAGNFLGSVIVGSFQDQLTPLQTWSKDFAVEFQKRMGYDFLAKVGQASGLSQRDEGTGKMPVLLWGDYQRVRAALAEEAFFKPLGERHARQGLLCGCDQKGHSRRGYPIDCVRMYADYQRTHRWFSAPGSDHRGDTKIHSSLAHLYGRPRVWLEAFHSSGWGATLEETFDWLIPYLGAGANLYNPHAVYYTTRGGWWDWAPPSTCWRQPYWRHYRHFARAISRLCAVFSQGERICNIAVLYPTSTEQAGLLMDRVLPAAQRAHDVYLQIVGQMVWDDPKPGALDRDRRDFDVLDEESVGRGQYRAIILPACTTLPAETERALRDFEKNGGKVIAVTNAEDVPSALTDVERLVDAPVVTLRRRLDGQDLLLVPAPSRDAPPTRVIVREVTGVPCVWDAYTGQQRPVAFEPRGDSQELTIDFQGEPLAVIVWEKVGQASCLSQPPKQTGRMPVLLLNGPWDVRLIPTNDHPVQCWQFEHRLDSESDWKTVHATFGPHGWWRTSESQEWRPAIYSLSRGIHKDPLHRHVYGVHGHVPEEFLDFGEVKAGQGAVFRTTIHSPEALNAHLAIGAPAAKHALLNGQAFGHDAHGYHWMVPVALRAGANKLEFRLTAEGDVRLRAYYAFVREPERFVRSEWISLADAPQRESMVRVSGFVEVPFLPSRARIRVAVGAACRVFLNGAEIGRQQQCENAQGDDSIRTYEPTEQLRAGRNEIGVEWTDAGKTVPLLVDALFESGAGQSVSLVTSGQWQAFRSGNEVGVQVRRVHGCQGVWWGARMDPAWAHLWRRPHPLLDSQVVLRVQPDAFPGENRVEWFRFTVPPGTTAIHTDVAGEVQQSLRDGVCTLRVVPQPGHSGGGVFRKPVSVEVGPGRMELGDWTTQGLSAYAGGVCYSRTVRLNASNERTMLDLGKVRGTAEVFINGFSAGVRVWSPYRFDLTEHVRAGDNLIEVQVFNTLAPYLDAVSPTPYVFPGQTESGLFGPVRIFSAT